MTRNDVEEKIDFALHGSCFDLFTFGRLCFGCTRGGKHEESVKLPDGSIAKITAEPINTGRALSGVWKITGTNGLATMEYWIELEKAGLYTKIKRTWGLAITGIMTSYEDAKINVVRQMESPVLPAIVEGYAKFTYFDNPVVTLWTKSGGVRASISGNQITTELY